MIKNNFSRALLSIATFGLISSQGYSLVTFNDGQHSLFVNLSTGITWDSNIHSSQAGASDHIFFANASVNLARRAGVITMDATASVNMSRFDGHTDENFANPHLSLNMAKNSGRLTGTLALSAQRQNRADSAANIRNESWYYNSQLNLRYPVISRYSLTGGVGFSERRFQNAPAYLVNDRVTNWSSNIAYAYTDQTELSLGYRGRYGETSAHDSYYDHAIMTGISGKILAKLTGNLNVGYQTRKGTKKTDQSHSSLTVSGSATWSLSPRMNVALNLSKDFSVASTNIHTDTLNAGATLNYSYGARLSLHTGVYGGESRFLGAGRKDEFFGGSIGGSYAVYGDYLRLHLDYSYFRNWSNTSISDYDRNSLSISASSRF